jgi:hypothetical protein
MKDALVIMRRARDGLEGRTSIVLILNGTLEMEKTGFEENSFDFNDSPVL